MRVIKRSEAQLDREHSDIFRFVKLIRHSTTMIRLEEPEDGKSYKEIKTTTVHTLPIWQARAICDVMAGDRIEEIV